MNDTDVDQQEPSMEEILASIRRIISEDGDEDSEAKAVAAISDGEDTPVEPLNDDVKKPIEILDDDVDGDILELTDVIDDDEPEPRPEHEPKLEGEIELVDDKLLSDEVEEVSVAAMSELTTVLAANAAVGDGDQTLEQLLKDVLRPILKQWLDDNLPKLVDRIVREEVERIAQRAK